ncbi:MAG: ATP-binding protein [Micrococcales bacterium]|nr:ATP-binding protein [Micrococcales bacterium]
MVGNTESTRSADGIRAVISGTYSTGKTTTATALSIATGLPLINALSAREILVDLYPGRRFQDMSAEELMALGLRRFEERCRAEAELLVGGSFISDGSVLNEWIYATVRRKIGINPGASLWHQVLKIIAGIPFAPFFGIYTRAFGQVARIHAATYYTHVVHLPVEFPMDSDGHRPVSERYRKISDRDIREEFARLDIPSATIGGSHVQRVAQIAAHLGLPLVMPAGDAVVQAAQTIRASREAVARRIIEQQQSPSVGERLRLATRF